MQHMKRQGEHKQPKKNDEDYFDIFDGEKN